MTVLDKIRKETTPSRNYVIKTKKKLHKGFLFGHVSNGGGTVDLGEGFALKFTALDDKFITVELIDFGKYNKIETQTWNKTKEAKPTEPKIVIKKSDTNERKNIFD